MEKLVVAILKSEHNVKFKKALVDKLLVSETSKPSAGFSMQDFLYELERLWSIGAESLDAMSSMDNAAAGYETVKQLQLKKKAKYESFKLHYAILSSVLKYLFKSLEQSSSQSPAPSDWCQHLVNLIKLYFLPNLNRVQYYQLVKYNLITLLAYLRLIIDAFNETAGSLQTRVNLMNILATVNTSFHLSYTSSLDAVTSATAMEVDDDPTTSPSSDVNFLYLVQNDCQFGAEYLSFLSSFVALVDWFFQYSSLDPLSLINQDSETDKDKIDFNAIKTFIEETVKDTLKLIILSVGRCHVNQLGSSTATADPAFSQDTTEWMSAAFSAKESFENLIKSALLIRILSAKSDKLYKHALTSLIELLLMTSGGHNGNEKDQAASETINENVVQLLSAFDLKKASFVLINYFQENQLKFVQDESLFQNLLVNLINLLTWPYEKKYLEKWICAIMSIFAQTFKMFNLLITVCELKAEYLLKLMLRKETRASALKIFTFFIINYQHSPKLFHKCCPRLFRLLIKIKPIVKENEQGQKIDINGDSDAQTYQHLALLSYYCITKFQGYPQVYKSILEVIQNDVNTISLMKFETTKDQYLIGHVSMETSTLGGQSDSVDDSVTPMSSEDLIVNKKTRPHLTGLSNLGNTCYLNSIVQSLFSCKKFVASILQSEDQPSAQQRSILFQLKVLFATMHLTKRPFIRATNFVKNCTPEWFRLGQQQDSSEFLMFILDNLHEKFKTSSHPSPSDETKPAVTQAPQQPTLIQQTFGIQLTTECQCSNCNTKTMRTDVCFYLPLSFETSSQVAAKQKEQKTSLLTLIDNFFKPENLSSENDNPYSCAQCESLQSATKRVLFTRDDERNILPPDYLILTLNRFIYQVATTTESTSTSATTNNLKIMDELEYPSSIAIETWNSSSGQLAKETYSLISVVIHSGSSLHYGHYYSYITNKREVVVDESTAGGTAVRSKFTEWLCANDSQITETSFENLVNNQSLFKDETPYVLFYQRDAAAAAAVNQTNSSADVDLSSLPIGKNFTDLIEQDNRVFLLEERAQQLKRQRKTEMDSSASSAKYFFPSKDDDDDQSGGGGSSQTPPSHCNNDSQRDSGPRIIF